MAFEADPDSPGELIDSTSKLSKHKRKRLQQWAQAVGQREVRWTQTYGYFRPPVVKRLDDGTRLISIFDTIYTIPLNMSFHDFLITNFRNIVGSDWCDNNRTHPVMRWEQEARNHVAKVARESGYTATGVPIRGPFLAYMYFVYEIFITRHCNYMRRRIIDRLKNESEFQGAKYELFVAATFIRAGFSLREIKKDGPEFYAHHPETGEIFGVEAKSKRRDGVLGFKGGAKRDELGIDSLLRDAVGKKTTYPLIVFIDINMPVKKDGIFDDVWIAELKNSIEAVVFEYNQAQEPFPAIAVYFTSVSDFRADIAVRTKFPLSYEYFEVENKYQKRLNESEKESIYHGLATYGNLPDFKDFRI